MFFTSPSPFTLLKTCENVSIHRTCTGLQAHNLRNEIPTKILFSGFFPIFAKICRRENFNANDMYAYCDDYDPSLLPLHLPSFLPSLPEVESVFQRLSTLLTVHTSKFSVLVAPLRATVLEVHIHVPSGCRLMLNDGGLEKMQVMLGFGI